MLWNYAYYPVIFDGYMESRDEIKIKLEKMNNFSNKYFCPITNRLSCYRGKYGKISLPVAEYAASNVLTLPMYADLSIEEADWICDVIMR